MQNIIESSTEILDQIRQLVTNDLDSVDHLMQQELISSVPLTREITQHIFKRKGKRLRSLLVILSAHALKNNQSNLETRHFELASVIEFVHTATLLHDDVVDHSLLRRGQSTANSIWGNLASVLVGDFLYSRAFQILARHNYVEIMSVLSEATNAIAEGEVMQLMNQKDAELTEESYFQVITQKTAKLFSAAAEIGAILQNANTSEQKAMATYGLHLGIAFQIIDDLLDYSADANTIGKNGGDDLSGGKATLPLIYAIKQSSEDDAKLIRQFIQLADIRFLPEMIVLLKNTNALSDAKNKAIGHANIASHALKNIPESAYRDALQKLVLFAVDRKY